MKKRYKSINNVTNITFQERGLLLDVNKVQGTGMKGSK